MMKSNPITETRELLLWARDNTNAKYILDSRGYDPRDLNGWRAVADEAAKQYAVEYASPRDWNKIFSAEDRRNVASLLRDEYFDALPAKNPLSRTSVAADSQRERVTTSAKGRATKTKSPSRRLMARRRTTEKAPEGFYANPLTRVKVNSPSMATGEPPDKRLIKRRKKTAKAPKGIWANPKSKPGARPKPFYYLIKSVPAGFFEGQYLSTHYAKSDVVKIAQAKADKYDVQASVSEFHP